MARDGLSLVESEATPVEEPLSGLPIGQILLRTAGLSRAKLDEALERQEEGGGRLGELLVGMKAVTEEQVLRALALQLDLPFVDRIRDDEVEVDLVRRIPINFAKHFKIMPLM